jgi:hypothetical protein
VRSAACSRAAVASMPRCRPARRSAAAIRVFDSFATAPGVGAIARTARASIVARLLALLAVLPFWPTNASTKLGSYSRSSDRSSLEASRLRSSHQSHGR